MLDWFAKTTMVATGLALVAALGSRLRSVGPAVRHALWLVVLIKLMTPPLVSWPWAISWRVVDWPITATQVVPDTRGNTLVNGDRRQPEQRHIARTSSAFAGRDRTPDSVKDAPPALLEARVKSEEIAAVIHHKWIRCVSPTEPGKMAWWVVSVWLAGSVVLGVGQCDPDHPLSPPALHSGASPGRPCPGG